MEPFQYLVFDPGGATGWARCVYSGGVSWEIESGTFWEPEHHKDIASYIRDLIFEDISTTVITESFEFRQSPDSAKQRRGLELVSREYIGVMKLICGYQNFELVQQMPSHAMSRMTDEKLELVGHLRKPLHDCRHENDALRHLFFRLIFKDRNQSWMDMLK